MTYLFSGVGRPCEHCGCLLLRGESSALCCFGGTLVLERRRGSRTGSRDRDNPRELEALLRLPTIGKHARAINTLFSLTSIGTKRLTGNTPNPAAGFFSSVGAGAGGLGCLRLHGQSYHRVLPGERAAGEECGLSYYMYDSSYEAARADLHKDVPPALIDDLRRYLMTNNGHVRQVSPQAVCRCSKF